VPAAIVWLLNVSRSGTRVEGCSTGCAPALSENDETLRVMSLNVLHNFRGFAYLRQRLDLIASEMRHRDVDIACLQEVPWTVYCVAHPGDRGFTCCIDDLSARSGATLSKRINYLFLLSQAKEIGIADSRRVLDEPTWVGERWLWASDHSGVLTTLSMR
jgi:hypothetical protein